MGALTTAYVAVLPDMKRFGPELKVGLRKVDVSSSGRDAGNRFSSGFQGHASKALKRGLLGAGVAAGAAFGGALTKGFGRLSAIENAEAKLTGLGHSAKTVDKIMVNALASVKGTAFGLDEAATVAATAVAAGIEPGQKLQRTLKLVADAATIGGTSLNEMGAIFNQVAASNKVQGDTINQLNERGIPILKLLGDVMGVSQGKVSELASKGKIDFATFQKAMEQGLGGAALKSGNTASGAFKNMGAAFSRVGAALLKGVFPQIGSGFGTVTKWLDAITPAALRFGERFGTALTEVSGGFRAFATSFRVADGDVTSSGFAGFMERLANALVRLRPLFGDVRAGAEALFDALIKGQETDTGNWFMSVVVGAVGVRRALVQLGTFVATTLLPAWLSWYKFLGSQLVPILKQLGGFVADSIVPAFRAVAGFIGTTVVPAFLSIVDGVKGLLRVVVPIIAQVVGAILGQFTKMRPQIMSIWNSVKEIITGVMFIIREVISSVTHIIQMVWDRWGDEILAVVKVVFGALFKIISGVMKSIAGVIKLIVALIKGDWSGAWQSFRQILQGAVDAVVAVLEGLWGIVKALFGGLWKSAKDATVAAWLSIKRSVIGGWNGITAALGSATNTVVTPIRKAWVAVRDATLGIWKTITEGIRRTIGVWLTVVKVTITGIVTAAILAFRPLLRGVQAVFNSIKDRVIAPVWRAIRGVFTSAQRAVANAWGAFWKAVKAVATRVWTSVYRSVIEPVWRRIRAVFVTVMGVIRAAFSTWWNNLRNNATKIFNAIRTAISNVWTAIRTRWTAAQTGVRSTWSTFWGNIRTAAATAINNVRTTISTVLGRIVSAFSTAKANIGRVWSGVKGVVSAPIEWVKNNVYNRPLVPVWNRVAGLVNGPKLSAYATGGVHGVRPGYTPGRDTHTIAVGGGEAIMRPEWTRAVGEDWVNGANKAARRGGKRGVEEFIHGGIPGFAGGGVVGWIRDKISGGVSGIGGLLGKIKDWALGGLRKAAEVVLNPVKGFIDRNMPGNGVGRTVGGVGKKAIDLVLDKIKTSDEAAALTGGQGITGPAGAMTTWHGGRFTTLAAKNLQKAQQIAGVNFRVMQGGWRPRTSYSGTSHAGDAVDTQASARVIRAIRAVGWASGDRTGLGNWGSHAHSVPSPSTGRARGSAPGQYQDYLRRGGASQGLRSPWGLADGGLVKGGRGGVLAGLGEGSRDELVTPLPRNWRRSNAVAGVTFSGPIHVHGVTDAAEMVRSLQQYAQRNGGVRLKVLTP